MVLSSGWLVNGSFFFRVKICVWKVCGLLFGSRKIDLNWCSLWV